MQINSHMLALAGFLSFNLFVNAAEQPTFETILERSEQPIKIVCFGDSVTGLYYHTGGRRAYTDMVQIGLQRTLPNRSFKTINAGISGHTAANGLNRIEKDVLAHKPDIVTVMFSLNDMTRGQPVSVFETQILDIVKQCQTVGAAVLLCTPNSVMETPARPIAKLEEYVAAIRKLSKEHQLPIADCYAAYENLRKKDKWAWTMLLSDEIHPNMGGHKLIAETIVKTITGKHVSLTDITATQPAVPFTLERLQNNNPIKILAMPPFDSIVEQVIRASHPKAKLEITTWETAEKTIAEIDNSSAQVRNGGYHFVIISIPIEAAPHQVQSQLRSFSWVLNKSLSFGKLEWDCLTITPAVTHPKMNKEEQLANSIAREFMLNQDLTVLDRIDSQDQRSPQQIFADWWKTQLQ